MSYKINGLPEAITEFRKSSKSEKKKEKVQIGEKKVRAKSEEVKNVKVSKDADTSLLTSLLVELTKVRGAYKLPKLVRAVKHGRKFIDILPNIGPGKADQAILKSWKAYFTSKGDPWFVTIIERENKRTFYKLWKLEATDLIKTPR